MNWEKTLAATLTQKEVEEIKKAVTSAFGSVTDEILGATKIPKDRDLIPEEFRATCQYCFNFILGL